MYLNFEVKLSLEIQNKNWILISWKRSFKRIEKLQMLPNLLVYLFRLYVWIGWDIVVNSINNLIQNSIPFVRETDSKLYKMIIDYCIEHLMKKTAVLLISTIFVFPIGKLKIRRNRFDLI